MDRENEKRLVGVATVTAVQPICQMAFGNKKTGGSENKKEIISMQMCFEDGIMRRVPVISGNSVRALLREALAKRIFRDIAPGTTDYYSLFGIFSGGMITGASKFDKGTIEQVFKRISAWRGNNPVVNLFGCGHPATSIIDGRLSLRDGIPTIQGLAQFTGEAGTLTLHDIISVRTYTRNDKLSRNEEVFNLLSKGEDGILEMVASDMAAKSKKAEDAEDTDKGEESSSGAVMRQMPFANEYIPAGTKFIIWLNILQPTKMEIGTLLGAFREFAKNPVIGGLTSKMYGLVNMDISLRLYDTDSGYSEQIGNIHILDYINASTSNVPAFSIENDTGILSESLDEFEKFLGTVKSADQLACPDVIKKEKKTKEKKGK